MSTTHPASARTPETGLDPVPHGHAEGLRHDVRTMVSRRQALGLFAGVSAAGLLAACGMDAGAVSSSAAAAAAAPAASAAGLSEIPAETAGPYPGDGSNGVNVLDDSGIVRRDIRSSFGSSTAVAEGVPLSVTLAVRDAATGDAMPGAAVYAWHCDRDGRYSLYSEGAEDENFLRGVQPVDDAGNVTFSTIYPGCYPGRWPHIHFEVYASVDEAIASGPIVRTSQLALPKETSAAVYATAGYEASVANLASLSLATDNVFGDDGGIHQLATMTGDPASGYAATLTVGV